MHPEPENRSSMVASERIGSVCMNCSTQYSVSGRGMRGRYDTSMVHPKNGTTPMIYATGTPRLYASMSFLKSGCVVSLLYFSLAMCWMSCACPIVLWCDYSSNKVISKGFIAYEEKGLYFFVPRLSLTTISSQVVVFMHKKV